MSSLTKKLNKKQEGSLNTFFVPDDIIHLFEGNTELVMSDWNDNMDFVLIFCEQKEVLNSIKDKIGPKLHITSNFWIAYPKKSSKKYKSDLSRDTLWDVFGSYDLEPVRQIAIDDDWSAIRYRHVSQIKTMTRSRAATKAGKEKVLKNKS